MLPPTDSINHHSLKLAEFVSSLKNQASMPSPPPPYAARPPIQGSEEVLGEVDDIDDDACNPPPVLIKIDTSVHVEGEANTIVIPCALTSGTEDGQNKQISTSDHSSTGPNQSNLQRQPKSAQLATSIIAGLRSSGALEDNETGRQRPIEISVNAGISIKGNKNVVCAGAKRPNPPPSHDSSDSSSNTSPNRKRRAVSEPTASRNSKRTMR